MRIAQHSWTLATGWKGAPLERPEAVQLVLFFCAPEISNPEQTLRDLYPTANIVGCTTVGEILGGDALDDSISAVAIHFEKSHLVAVGHEIHDASSSHEVGVTLASSLPKFHQGHKLRSVFVLSDGIHTNGTALIAGLLSIVEKDVLITGGLAGDGPHFRSTRIGLNAPLRENFSAAIGFYGDQLDLACGSDSGWMDFGPERVISRSSGTKLYELDGEPALELYRRYLGDEARNLPGSALFFPLTIRSPSDSRSTVVRTIVGISEPDNALIFAGDIPTGHVARLMRGDINQLIDSAGQAGESARGTATDPRLAILVSCIGRKLLMGQSTYEEVEEVQSQLGAKVVMTGFYSYGEIAPHPQTGRCELHNQTMTITTIGEL